MNAPLVAAKRRGLRNTTAPRQPNSTIHIPFLLAAAGNITLALLEAIRRRPINSKFLEIIQTGCAVAVMLFLAYVTFFDVSEFLPGRKSKAAPVAAEVKAEPGAPAPAPAAKEAAPEAK